MNLTYSVLKTRLFAAAPMLAISMLSACATGNIARNTAQVASFNMREISPFRPYAGSYYPVYNQSIGQWIEPTEGMPFDKISMLFIAFAHAYPGKTEPKSAFLSWEHNQDAEPARARQLTEIARKVHPKIKILVSLGWEHGDWDYINTDYTSGYNTFPTSVVNFLRENRLDGFDIDDEAIGGSSGSISQANFDGVIQNLRLALDQAGQQDGTFYYLTITPAGNNHQSSEGFAHTQVSAQNMHHFDFINVQSYFSEAWGDKFISQVTANGYPLSGLAVGVNSEDCDTITIPENYTSEMAGLFNWNMSSDSACSTFAATHFISELLGY